LACSMVWASQAREMLPRGNGCSFSASAFDGVVLRQQM
jgi:hypothetical protein